MHIMIEAAMVWAHAAGMAHRFQSILSREPWSMLSPRALGVGELSVRTWHRSLTAEQANRDLEWENAELRKEVTDANVARLAHEETIRELGGEFE